MPNLYPKLSHPVILTKCQFSKIFNARKSPSYTPERNNREQQQCANNHPFIHEIAYPAYTAGINVWCGSFLL
jgi:hypothetical protein